jgi:hypothetical protein
VFESYLKKLNTIEGINGSISVDPQDGSLLLKEGNVHPLLEDITAFFGSGFDVVASSLGIKGLKLSYLEKEDQRFIIIVKEGGYIGCEISDNISFDSIIEEILRLEGTELEGKKEKEEEKEKVEATSGAEEETSEVRFLKSKIRQINLLVEEFSEKVEKSEWLKMVQSKLSDSELGEKLADCLGFDNDTISYKGRLDSGVKEEEISNVSKTVTDLLCRKAVDHYGAMEAKKKVHKVIEKLGIGK